MNFRHMSDAISFDKGDHVDAAPAPSWPPVDSLPWAPTWHAADSFTHPMIHTGDNGAGDGGDGFFSGTLLSSPTAIFKPVDMAMADLHGVADAHQSNTAQLDQSGIQIAGVGGNGGDRDAATGGDVSIFGSDNAFGHNWLGSAAISSGANDAGNGGDGYAYGNLIHASYALFEPINIAIAGYNSNAHAEQTNNVEFDQSAVQMAGIGGDGGDGNGALGGNVGIFSSGFGFGSDVIETGTNSAGNGGSGHFAGELIDVGIAIYAPINIAISGYNSTADAHQTNNVFFDQSTTQIAGIGGDGGHDNLALGGDFATHLLSDLHLLW